MLAIAAALTLVVAGQAPASPACDAEPNTRVRVLVLDLAGTDVAPELLRTLGQIVAREAAAVQGYQVLSSDELRTVLDQEAEKQLFGCSESSCLAEFAGALDADLLVSGQIDQTLAGSTTLSLNLLNTRAIVTMNRVNLTWAGDVGRLPELARAAAMLLLVEKAKRPLGAVALEGLVTGASVFIDDADRTDAIVEGAISGLDVGTHTVRVTADGYEPLETSVLVASVEPVRVDATLVERSLFSSGWLWAGIGVAVVASVAATAGVFIWATDATVQTSADFTPATLSNVEAVKR